MDHNLGIRGKERYKESARSADKQSYPGDTGFGTFKSSNQFGKTPIEPKKISVMKPAPTDTKLEGFSISRTKTQDHGAIINAKTGVEDQYINNLQQQIYFTELEIKLLKDQEQSRANKFMGGLEAGPLTENLVMLKGKYRKIQDELQAKIDELTQENRELAAKNSSGNVNYSRFLEEIKDLEHKLQVERENFDKESEKYRKAISTATFLKGESAKNHSDTIKARDLAKTYTGETRIKIDRQASLLASLEEKLSQAEVFKSKMIDEKNKQILSLQEKLSQLEYDVKNNSTLGIFQEKLTFLNANKQEVEMERDNLVNKIKSLKQSKQIIEKAAVQLSSEKRALINQVEELKLTMDREKSQHEVILTQKVKQKEQREHNGNLTLIEDTRSDHENITSLLKNLIAMNTDLSEQRTQLHYDLEELKEKKNGYILYRLVKDFDGLKTHCINLEADLTDIQSKIKVFEDRVSDR